MAVDVQRVPRRDAVRSRALLLEAARAVFAEQGVDAPPRAVTERAALAVGTLYRHFPRRSDLIVAVFRSEIDRCAEEGRRLRREEPPAAALDRWMDAFVQLVATKHGLAAALHSDDPAYAGLLDAVWDALLPVATGLLQDGEAVGLLRADLSARELLTAVALLCQGLAGEDGAARRRAVAVLLRGLRTG